MKRGNYSTSTSIVARMKFYELKNHQTHIKHPTLSRTAMSLSLLHTSIHLLLEFWWLSARVPFVSESLPSLSFWRTQFSCLLFLFRPCVFGSLSSFMFSSFSSSWCLIFAMAGVWRSLFQRTLFPDERNIFYHEHEWFAAFITCVKVLQFSGSLLLWAAPSRNTEHTGRPRKGWQDEKMSCTIEWVN